MAKSRVFFFKTMLKFSSALFSVLLIQSASSQEIRINFITDTKPVFSIKTDSINLSATPEKYQKTLEVFLVNNNVVSEIPLSGKYLIEYNELVFEPFNDLGRGLTFEARNYRVTDTVTKRIQIPYLKAAKTPLTVVLNFYPLTNAIPGNILRFHIEFSNQMINDEMAFQNIKVLNEKNEEVKMMWRQKSYWINDRILVMMIHPGRVKKGITNYSELGPMFEFGKEYTMLVTTKIKDSNDRDLKQEYKRKFKIVEDDRAIPTIIYDKFILPKVNSKEPLQLQFNEGMDYVSLIEGILIINKSTQERIKGNFKANKNDSTWFFIPDLEWKNVKYEIIFDKEIGDFACNHLHRLFEITNLNELNEDKMPIHWEFEPK